VLVDATSGLVVGAMRHDPWGRRLEDSLSTLIPFDFEGGMGDTDTGLVRFGARDYDPEVGRWLTKGPIPLGAHGANVYGYALHDPINLQDPNGRDVCRNSAPGFAHHDWVTIDNDPNSSYGYWSNGDGKWDLLGGPGTMFSLDPYAERNETPAESVCVETTDAEEKELEKWLRANFGPAHHSRYFLGVMTCQDFAEETMDQLERIKGSPWRSFVDGVLDALWYPGK